MSFCPSCKYEYIPGITTCPDCDVELVEKLPEEEPKQETDPSGLVAIADYHYAIEAETDKLKLDSAGIDSCITNEITTPLIPTNALGTIRIMVRDEDAQKALEVLSQELEIQEEQNS